MSRNAIQSESEMDWSKLDPEGEKLWALGSKFEEEGRIELAAEAYLAAAKRGDPLAQVNLANILDDNLNRPTEAIYWYKRAVRFGYSAAALNLAVHYGNLGVRRWQIHWLKVAARMGDEWAISDLKELHLTPAPEGSIDQR